VDRSILNHTNDAKIIGFIITYTNIPKKITVFRIDFILLKRFDGNVRYFG